MTKKFVLLALIAILFGSTAHAELVTIDGQVLADGGVVSITDSDGSAFTGVTYGDGFSFGQSNGFMLTINGGTGLYDITIGHIASRPTSGSPYTWNGVGNSTETVGFTTASGTWVDNSSFAFSDGLDITGTTIEGAANGSNDAARLSYGEDWGTITAIGTDTITYFSNETGGGDGFSFFVTQSAPEPSSAALLSLGMIALAGRRRRRRESCRT